MTTNQIEYWKLQEATRHNKAQEAENYRHDVADEGIRQYSAQTSYEVGKAQAQASYLSAQASTISASANSANAKTNRWGTIAGIAGKVIGGALTAVALLA